MGAGRGASGNGDEGAFGGTTKKSYTHGFAKIEGIGSMVEANDSVYGLQYPETDHRGSVHELSDESETVRDEYEYNAFGEELSKSESEANRFTYQSNWFAVRSANVSECYSLSPTRPYNPSEGRFVARDVLLALNRYLYVSDVPTKAVDPLGLEGECCGLELLEAEMTLWTDIPREHVGKRRRGRGSVPLVATGPGVQLKKAGERTKGPSYFKLLSTVRRRPGVKNDDDKWCRISAWFGHMSTDQAKGEIKDPVRAAPAASGTIEVGKEGMGSLFTITDPEGNLIPPAYAWKGYAIPFTEGFFGDPYHMWGGAQPLLFGVKRGEKKALHGLRHQRFDSTFVEFATAKRYRRPGKKGYKPTYGARYEDVQLTGKGRKYRMVFPWTVVIVDICNGNQVVSRLSGQFALTARSGWIPAGGYPLYLVEARSAAKATSPKE